MFFCASPMIISAKPLFVGSIPIAASKSVNHLQAITFEGQDAFDVDLEDYH
jgi:hypothetical protein